MVVHASTNAIHSGAAAQIARTMSTRPRDVVKAAVKHLHWCKVTSGASRLYYCIWTLHQQARYYFMYFVHLRIHVGVACSVEFQLRWYAFI